MGAELQQTGGEEAEEEEEVPPLPLLLVLEWAAAWDESLLQLAAARMQLQLPMLQPVAQPQLHRPPQE